MYLLDSKNHEIVNKTFDKLHNQKYIIWAENHILSNYSVFIIWWDALINNKITKKKQVIVDFRNFNKITKSDIYSIFLQTDIIQAIAECSYIFIFDAISFFYQWQIYSSHHQHLLTVSHCEQKIFKITIMSFCNESLDMLHKRLTEGSLTSWHNEYSSMSHRQNSEISWDKSNWTLQL